MSRLHINSSFLFVIYSRTPGSRQPSPADETLTRPQTLLDPNGYQPQHFPQHMMNTSLDQHHHVAAGQQYHPQAILNHQIQAPVMNGVGSLQVPQVRKRIILIQISLIVLD